MDIRSTVTLHTGRTMPVLGLGTWELTDDTADAIESALRLGYRLIDTSGDYGSQPGIGVALARGVVPREQVYLVAKVEEDEDAYASVKKNLAEMEQDYADLFLVHRPPEDGAGAELYEGLVRAREEGLARDIGVSNYSIGRLEQLMAEVGEVPAVNQVEWTPFGWSRSMLAWCRDLGIVIQGYSPLTRAEDLDDDELAAIAREAGATPAQVMLRWSMQLGVVPLPKANRREHQQENLGAFDVELSDDLMERASALNRYASTLGETLQYM